MPILKKGWNQNQAVGHHSEVAKQAIKCPDPVSGSVSGKRSQQDDPSARIKKHCRKTKDTGHDQAELQVADRARLT